MDREAWAVDLRMKGWNRGDWVGQGVGAQDKKYMERGMEGTGKGLREEDSK